MMARSAVWGLHPGDIKAAAEKNPTAVNMADDSGWAALHYAAFEVDEDVARALLEAGADRNVRTLSSSLNNDIRPGSTPLHLAVARNIPKDIYDDWDMPGCHLEYAVRAKAGVLKLLLDAGADATAADCNGCTPLHALALIVYGGGWDPREVQKCYGSVDPFDQIGEMMAALIAAGASMDAADEDGLTPRHLLLLYSKRILGTAVTAQLAGVPEAQLDEMEAVMKRGR